MLVNPYSERDSLITFSGTRVLQNDFGLIGTQLPDITYKAGTWQLNPERTWVIQGIYAPIRSRTVQGIRARVMDYKGYSSFINQVDLEWMLGHSNAGVKCPWTGRRYAEPGDQEWFGLCMDDDDLADDLLAREQLLRGEYADMTLPEGSEILRRIHCDDFDDREELLVLLWDGDFATGISPDFRLETIKKRWAAVAKEKAPYHTR